MRLPLDKLGLDLEITERDLVASIGFGRAYATQIEQAREGSERAETMLAAASSYRRAGASAMMLGSRQLMYSAFQEAGRLYESLGSPYGLLMYALSGETTESLSDRTKNFRNAEGVQAREWEAQLVYQALLGSGSIPVERDIAPPFPWMEDVTLGVFEMPVWMYWMLAFGLRDHNERLQDSLRPFLVIYDANLRVASSHVHHWRLLVQRMHPAEPDIIGLLCAVFLARPDTRLGAITEGVSPLTRTIIEGCLDTRFNGQFLR